MSGTDYLLDTNAVLGYLGGNERVCAFVEKEEASGASFAVSVITKLELLSFPRITPQEEAAVLEFLTRVSVLPITDEVERHTVQIRRQRRAKLPDAIILATARTAGRVLLTSDEGLTGLSVSGLSIQDPCA